MMSTLWDVIVSIALAHNIAIFSLEMLLNPTSIRYYDLWRLIEVGRIINLKLSFSITRTSIYVSRTSSFCVTTWLIIILSRIFQMLLIFIRIDLIWLVSNLVIYLCTLVFIMVYSSMLVLITLIQRSGWLSAMSVVLGICVYHCRFYEHILVCSIHNTRVSIFVINKSSCIHAEVALALNTASTFFIIYLDTFHLVLMTLLAFIRSSKSWLK